MKLSSKQSSIHLQNFPDIGFLNEETGLVADMDLIRNICSSALAIRDNKNLRVRLPLNSLTVIGRESSKILPFSEIIADEVNVKNILTQEDFSKFAQLKLQVNFKKIGAKYGSRVKEINACLKNSDWQQLANGEVEIAGINLKEGEFDLKLEIINCDEKLGIVALSSNDFLVMLELELTEELISEGIARDLVRSIQQNRKDAQLDISDEIILQIFSQNIALNKAVQRFKDYITEQVLARNIQIIDQLPEAKFCFETTIENAQLFVGFDV